MAHPLATWPSKAGTLGAALFAAVGLPMLAAVTVCVMLTLIAVLALVGALAKSRARRVAAREVLTLLLCCARPIDRGIGDAPEDGSGQR